MRLLHFADLHLGVENYGNVDPRTGMSTRVGDFLNSLDTIIARAINEPVDAVLFAGDAFKNRDPNPTVQREFARRIATLARHNVPIVLLVGNHDLPNASTRATANEIYQVLEIPGVHVCREIDLMSIPTRSGALQVVSLPWVTRSLFLNREEFRLIADIDLNRAMRNAITGAIGRVVPELNPAHPAVLVAHVSVQGASLGVEQSIMLGGDVTVGLDELHATAFDYIALGHIHRYQVVGTHPPAVYSGSPERIDFGEEREPKGFVLVDINEVDGVRRTISEFVALRTRRFETIRIDASGDAPMEKVERELSHRAADVADAIVRCYIKVEPGRERVAQASDVRRMLTSMGARFVANVVIESETVSRSRWELDDESGLDSASMLRRWVETKNYDPALAERVLSRGLALIERRRQRHEGGSKSNG